MRAFLRPVLAGVAALAASGALAGPARAATEHVRVVVPPATVAAGDHADIGTFVLADRVTAIENPKLVFELSSDLDGVTLSNAYTPDDVGCTPDGRREITCRPNLFSSIGPTGSNNQEPGVRVSAPAAALGETGSLKVTFSADGIAPVSGTAEVTVGQAVNLRSYSSTTDATAGLGGPFDSTLSVLNQADITAHGVAIRFVTDYAFEARERYSNCYYDGDRLSSCLFDQDLAAGGRYEVTVPYRVAPASRAPNRALGLDTWLTRGDYADLIASRRAQGLGGPGTPGTGPQLALTETQATGAATGGAAEAGIKQTDPVPIGNDADVAVTITGKQGADLVAIGATEHTAAGRTVPVTVGVRNDGPAADDRERRFTQNSGDPAAVAVVTPPPGATVTTIPDGCHQSSDQWEFTKPGTTQYFCESAGLLLPHATTTWTFRMKVTRSGTGRVELNPACTGCDRFTADTDKSNDKAAIVVDLGSGAGGDGGLPITGPRSVAVGGGGVALVLAGAAGFLIARRRRTRFEA